MNRFTAGEKLGNEKGGFDIVISNLLVTALILIYVISVPGKAATEVRPQFGLEGYGGANRLFIMSPWAGIRFGLGRQVSWIIRYHYHNFRYDYHSINQERESILKMMKSEVNGCRALSILPAISYQATLTSLI